MKKLFLLLTAMLLCGGMWALDNVPYVDADGTTKYANNVTEITDASATLDAGWYVVTGTDVQTARLVCSGEVHLILTDSAKLTATGANRESGIQVTGDNNSLTIYGQQNQIGQLIANGGRYGAGIGGGQGETGSNITINGGIITANGGPVGAGIGGGAFALGSNIIINGGTVTATGGGPTGAGIGGGNDNTSSFDIFVNASLVLIADENNPPTNHIAHTSAQDVSSKLFYRQYVIVRQPVKNITITFDKQEGTGGLDQVIVDENAAMPTISSLPTLDNYAFGGYYGAPNGQGTKYYNADGTSAHIFDKTEATTLYALWSIPHVDYVDAAGVPHTADAVAEVTNTTTTLNAGWHVVRDAEVQTGGLVCNGDVHLILADGAKLTATGADQQAGIQVSDEGTSLTIYGQSAQTGQLIATGGTYGAGIGGEKKYRVGSNITINGGIVKATGGDNGAGIGGGLFASASNITINGGDVTATGGDNATGIGGGYLPKSSSSNIVVDASLALIADENNPPTNHIANKSGQDVTRELTGKRYAIVRQPVKSITITLDKQEGTGGVVQVVVDESADMPTISSLPTLDNYAFGGYYSAPKGHGTKYYNPDGTSAHIFDKTEAITLYALWSIPHVDYVDADGVPHTADAVAEVTNTTTILNAGWHAVVGDNVQTAGLVCNGEVHLILVDGAKLTASGANSEQAGIQVSGDGTSLTIYGQSAQTGELIAKGGEKGAGIGGGAFASGSNIIINGGIVRANGGYYGAAGIGGGWNGNGFNITINGGKVTANGAGGGAGIGCGGYGDGNGNNIIINGGEVTANGGRDASAIGGIDANHSSNIYVSELLILKAGNSENPTEIIAHTSTQDVAQDLVRKRYATIKSASVTIATHYAADKGANYSTFYNGMVSYEVMTEGVTLYTASMETVGSETSLSLHEIEGYILPAGTAVVVRSENEEKVRLAPYIGSTEGIDVSGNVLRGVDVETATTELPGTLYVLSAQQQSGEGVATTAFYRYTGETMAPHKAFLQLTPDAPAPTRIVWGNRPVPTEIENVSGNENANENANANKVLRDGALYIIKGTRVYNAQGVLVE